MKFESLLIITYGRSGSTLLQGVLNSIDNVLVRGENYDFCYGLFLAWQALARARRDYGNHSTSQPVSPWYGAGKLDPGLFLEDMRDAVRKQLVPADMPHDTVYGFKEIRYIHRQERLATFLDFLRMLFPNPGFVFLTRNHDDVRRSAWWRKRNADEVLAELAAADRRFGEYCESRDNSFHVRYEDIVADSENLRPLFEFLGADFHERRIEAVLRTPHSYNPTIRTLNQAGVPIRRPREH